jgi:hypothetical protein
VSVFRPSARATSPDGREWEIYAYRVQLPERGRGALRRLRWLLVDLPAAALPALRSDDWRIQAITWLPHREAYTWTTTREFRGQVLAQVEGHLARGDVPPQRLTNAVFLGTS